MIIQFLIDKINNLKDKAFDGDDYQHERDFIRLKKQADRIYRFVADSEWKTLREISVATGAPEASVSACLRHLRKPKYGGHTVEKKYAGSGVYQYRVIFVEQTEEMK